MAENTSGGDRRGLTDEDLHRLLQDLERSGVPDPAGSSCPPEYADVPLADILAEAEPAEAGARPGFTEGGPLDLALPGLALASFCEEVTGEDGRCHGTSDNELIGVLRALGAHRVLGGSAQARGHRRADPAPSGHRLLPRGPS